MRKILLIFLFLFTHFAYSKVMNVPYISSVDGAAPSHCNQISPAALCYKVSWDSFPTNIDDNVIAPSGYEYNIYILQNNRGAATFYGWDTNTMPQSVPVKGTAKIPWQSVITSWFRVNGSSGTGYIHLNSGNQGKGIGCFQFGGIKNGLFSTDYVTLPGTNCRRIPPPKNECEITTATNNEFTFDFGTKQRGEIDGASLTIQFNLSCTLPTSATAYLASASNKIYLDDGQDEQDDGDLYTTMSLDNVDFTPDGTRTFTTHGVISNHTLTATLHKTAEKIKGGEYSGSSALIISVD